MKLHRVLLFTKIQMEIIPVGEDLQVILTGGDVPYMGCVAYACPEPEPDDPEVPQSNISIITTLENPEETFCIYVADELSKKTGKHVVCSGGIYVDNPTEHEKDKLYENIDDLIKDWLNFY